MLLFSSDFQTMAFGAAFPHLLCLLVTFRGLSTAMCTQPSEECTEDIPEDTSFFLQKHVLGFEIDRTQTGEFEHEVEDDRIEDDLDLDFDYQVESMRIGNGSRQACFKCKKGLRSIRRAIIVDCRETVKTANNGTKPRRSQIVACVQKEYAEKCKDECTYGSPCDQCKRAVSKTDLWPFTKKCLMNASVAMKKLCVDSCSESENFRFLEYDEDDDTGASSSDKRDLNATKFQKKCSQCTTPKANCLWCIRRDHNFGVFRECGKKFPGNVYGSAPDSEKSPDEQKNFLRCVGDAIYAKCKDTCQFETDPCMQCKRDVIIKREERVIRVDRDSCMDEGRATLCVDECSDSLVEE